MENIVVYGGIGFLLLGIVDIVLGGYINVVLRIKTEPYRYIFPFSEQIGN